jgi:hypothetical protein
MNEQNMASYLNNIAIIIRNIIIPLYMGAG